MRTFRKERVAGDPTKLPDFQRAEVLLKEVGQRPKGGVALLQGGRQEAVHGRFWGHCCKAQGLEA